MTLVQAERIHPTTEQRQKKTPTGSYLNIVFWPRVQHCCNVALVMNGDEQPTRRNKTRTHRETRQSDSELNKGHRYCVSLYRLILPICLGEWGLCSKPQQFRGPCSGPLSTSLLQKESAGLRVVHTWSLCSPEHSSFLPLDQAHRTPKFSGQTAPVQLSGTVTGTRTYGLRCPEVDEAFCSGGWSWGWAEGWAVHCEPVFSLPLESENSKFKPDLPIMKVYL